MLLKNGEKDTPHPVVEYLFSQLAQTRAFPSGTDRIFCYFCPQLTLAAEQSGAAVRLLPFQTPQDCFAYLRESGYEREESAAVCPAGGWRYSRMKQKKCFGSSGRKRYEQRKKF